MSDIDLPTVDQHDYSRLVDCLDHAQEAAVTQDEAIKIDQLRTMIINKSEEVTGDERKA